MIASITRSQSARSEYSSVGRDAAEHGVRLRLLHPALLDRAAELLLDLAHPLVERPLIDLPHDDVPTRLGADLGDPVAHEPAAHDADLADRHIRSLLFCEGARQRDPFDEVT